MFRRILSLGVVLALSACQKLQPVVHEKRVASIEASSSSPLVKASKRVTGGGGVSHFMLLNEAQEALEWRLALVDSATSSLDIQTFIWSSDASGRLLFERLVAAADRGVRVRLLVDDIWLRSDEAILAALVKHPNLDARLYNPHMVRGSTTGRISYFLMNYKKMNRRMHNKTFIADGVFAINGGRNIGDHYFGLNDRYNFRDLDVLTTGRVLEEVRAEFDEFWNSDYAYPAGSLSEKGTQEAVTAALRKLRNMNDEQSRGCLASFPVERRNWSGLLKKLPRKMVKGNATFIGDCPTGGDRAVVDKLTEGLAGAQSEIVIVSPYFIPYSEKFSKVAALVKQGVRVRVVVPSLGVNNHTATHAHYRKYRRAILDAGCELYEYNFQPKSDQRELCDTTPVTADFIGMHMKAIAVDQRSCFIGSLNLDPRAMDINTEEGLIIDSPALTQALLAEIDGMLEPGNAWKLEYDQRGRIVWLTPGEEPLKRQPARGFAQRIVDSIVRWIPIESEL